jgi:hypothetical protein
LPAQLTLEIVVRRSQGTRDGSICTTSFECAADVRKRTCGFTQKRRAQLRPAQGVSS